MITSIKSRDVTFSFSVHLNSVTAEADKHLSAFELSLLDDPAQKFEPAVILRKGDLCPQCGEGKVDYNGMLDLECPKCGFISGGGGGCT